jgi:primosomal protein N' (replication factor Y)
MKEYVYNILPSARIPGKNFLGFWYKSHERLHEGDLVQVPLGNRKVPGLVLFEVTEEPKNPLKFVSEVLVPGFFASPRIHLLRWFAEHYHVSAGLVLHLFLTGYSKVTRMVKLKKTPPQKKIVEKKITLNAEQEAALDVILKSFKEKKRANFLLFGPTGSGKTEVYLRACQAARKEQRQCLILVPEIALTPQTLSRFTSRFSDDVFIYHSKMTPAQKRAVMEAALTNSKAIVVGPRSALFLPYKNLGLIIFDEEHDSSFQQMDQNPHFDARTVARKYGEFLNIPVIFGDATPSIELFHETEQSQPTIQLLPLHKRISHSSQDIPFPKVSIVDLIQEIKRGNRSPFSGKLLANIQETLENKEQVFLFLNRRGLASSVICISCTNVITCKNCSGPLVLHGSSLQCHQCGYKKDFPHECPTCKKPTLKARGIGTEKIAQEISKLFPKARIARVDTDTVKTHKQHHEMYNRIKNHEVDIVIGTQMIAQGLDIPNVQLVGVIQCDNALNLPDFHSEERVFQLLMQVSGRAGRVKKQGNVIIQTFFPLHPVFEAVRTHDYKKFYQREIRERKGLNNPPYAHYVACIFQHAQEKVAEDQAKFLVSLIQPNTDIEIMGPSPAFIFRRRNMYRWQVLLKAKSLEQVPFDMIPNTWDIYVDPQSILL